MLMRHRNLAILAAVVLALGAFIFLYERDLPSTDERTELEKKVLGLDDGGEIEAVRLEHGGESLRLEKGDDGWRLTEPIADVVEETRVESLVGTLAGLEKTRTLEDADRAELGLEEPLGRIAIVASGGEEIVLSLGGEVPASSARVVGIGGRSDAYLVSGSQADELIEALERPIAEWRSSAWSTFEVFEIGRAVFEDAEGELTLERDGADWRRGGERVAHSAASDLLYAIAEAEAEELLSPEEATARGHALETPRLEITFSSEEEEGESKSESLALYAALDGFAAARREGREAILLLSEAEAAEIENALVALRSAETLLEEDPPEEELLEDELPEEEIPAEIE